MSSWRPLLWDRLLTVYGHWTPHHPGKWRVIVTLANKAHETWIGPRLLELGGTKYMLDPRNKLEREMFYLNSYDRSETQLLRGIVKPGWVVLDVGSNFGYYALLFANLVGAQGCVHSFEPDSSNYGRLTRNIEVNGLTNIRTFQVGVGDRCGEASLILPPSGNPAEIRLGSGSEQGSKSVSVTTLDHHVDAEKLERVDFIKLDVEGFELRVLQGGKKTLRRFRPKMMIETHPALLSSLGSSPKEFVRTIPDLGYSLYLLGWRGKLLPIRELPARWANVIAVPS